MRSDHQEDHQKRSGFLIRLAGKVIRIEPQHEEMDAVRLLTWTDDQFAKEMEKQKKNPLNQVQLVNASLTANAFRKLGIIPGIDMEEAYRKKRVSEFGAPQEDMTESIKKKLQNQ